MFQSISIKTYMLKNTNCFYRSSHPHIATSKRQSRCISSSTGVLPAYKPCAPPTQLSAHSSSANTSGDFFCRLFHFHNIFIEFCRMQCIQRSLTFSPASLSHLFRSIFMPHICCAVPLLFVWLPCRDVCAENLQSALCSSIEWSLDDEHEP